MNNTNIFQFYSSQTPPKWNYRLLYNQLHTRNCQHFHTFISVALALFYYVIICSRYSRLSEEKLYYRVHNDKCCCTTTLFENFHTLIRTVTPTFKPTSPYFENVQCLNASISTIRIMLFHLQAIKGKRTLGAEKAQVHTQQIMQNCWHMR
jgi:hypothetical protein